MKTCKTCIKEIDEKAQKCPYCRSSQKSWLGRHRLIAGILLLFILIIVSFGVSDYKSRPIEKWEITPTPTPIADQKWIDDAGQRYYDNHSSMPGFKEQFTLDKSKKLMEMCIDLIKDKGKCENVVEKKFWIGMSSDWATFSLGSPNKVNRTVVEGLTEEQWVYGNPIYGATYLYFYNDVLKSYQN